MKDDAPAPETVPTKRRHIEAAPDLWLRQWLARDDLWVRDRRRLEKEVKRRKDAKPQVNLVVVAGEEGTTPEQVRRAREELDRIQPTKVIFIGRLAKITHLFPSDSDIETDYLPVLGKAEVRNVIRDNATIVLAFPKEPLKPDKVLGVWDAVRFAKHRNLPVRIVLPDGSPTEGRQ